MKYLEGIIKDQIESCSGQISVVVEMGEWSFEYNSNKIYSSASLIKIPILIEAFQQYESGIFDLDDRISMKEDMIVGGSGVLQALNQTTWSIKDLMTLMIIVSDNTATNLLIDLLGKDSINNCMESLQLNYTKLQRRMMDFDKLKQGRDNKTSASDIVLCLKSLDARNGFLSKKSCEIAKSILQQQQFKGKIPALMDAEKVYVGSKTGELPSVEHDCAIVSYNEKTAYIAVLIDQIPEGENCLTNMQEIGKALFLEMVR